MTTVTQSDDETASVTLGKRYEIHPCRQREQARGSAARLGPGGKPRPAMSSCRIHLGHPRLAVIIHGKAEWATNWTTLRSGQQGAASGSWSVTQ